MRTFMFCGARIRVPGYSPRARIESSRRDRLHFRDLRTLCGGDTRVTLSLCCCSHPPAPLVLDSCVWDWRLMGQCCVFRQLHTDLATILVLESRATSMRRRLAGRANGTTIGREEVREVLRLPDEHGGW